jgi:hypothetical protein
VVVQRIDLFLQGQAVPPVVAHIMARGFEGRMISPEFLGLSQQAGVFFRQTSHSRHFYFTRKVATTGR